MPIHQPHDKYIRYTLSRVEEANSFFQNSLPEPLRKIIDFSTLEKLSDTYISETLKELLSDILFKVNMDGETGFIYILFDHKSQPSKDVYLQLLKYMIEIWINYTIENENWEKLPPIIPFVLYHGKVKWNVSTSFFDIISTDNEAIKRYHLDYGYILHDLANFSDEQIKGRVITRTALLVLKHIFDKPEGWNDVLKLLEQLFLELSDSKGSLDFIRATLTYLFNSAEVSGEDVKKVIETSLGQKGSEVFMTVRQKWVNEAKHERDIEIAIKMFKKKANVKFIMEVTDLSLEEIENLKAKI